ncbi:TonB-dependent siderophore receptor [Thiomicrorhabdus sp. Kp2]|uniref:TonB-dependent receptor plug domain-containing protein n=1 Tax=Thiomicrorhabdus sp. Kp2 TaxID=1123518 RepID=UPI00041F5ADF|nr:TonB-dependent receptor [Thiomicrorhabdus sp. Kp2]
MKKKLLVSIIASILSPAVYADSLPQIEVIGSAEQINQQQISKEAIETNTSSTSDVVNILKQSPSVSVNQAGAISGFPVIRGLADDRLNVQVDGMQLLSSCPNHMNTPLSYVSPSQVESIEIYPGITPVSMGGDSIGGGIAVKTNDPIFAPKGKQITEGEIGGYYRSNGEAFGGDVRVTTASDKLNLTYKGSYAKSGNYDAAEDFKTVGTPASTNTTIFTDGTEGSVSDLDEVAGTAYETKNHNLSMAYKGDDSLFKATVIKQDTPYQQYPNQRMDMTKNESTKINLSLEKAMSWGDITLQAYNENVDHEMAFMDYKRSAQMPMDTESTTQGLKASALIPLNESSEVNIGAELQTYTLDDYWSPNMDSMGMKPNTFLNINNGTRDRYALFAELKQDISPEWKTRLGARYERVNSNAGDVQGYNGDRVLGMWGQTNEGTESAAFNASDRSITDDNLNLTALANYKSSDTFDMDFGLARQVRSPNLYERYTWSTWGMAAIMNNFYGDGHGYVGNLNLKPETAYTLSANMNWHSADNKTWDIQVMPYISHVDNYIDAEFIKNYMGGDFGVYKYVNESARIYGIDMASKRKLAENKLGSWNLKTKINYTRGVNLDTDDNLYNMMPLNATIGLEHKINRWNNMVEVVMVTDKTEVSENRKELKTAGYSLVNFKTSYTIKDLRLDFGVDNLFNVAYDLPTGGAYTGEGGTMNINGVPLMSVPGAGRSIYAGFNLKF